MLKDLYKASTPYWSYMSKGHWLRPVYWRGTHPPRNRVAVSSLFNVAPISRWYWQTITKELTDQHDKFQSAGMHNCVQPASSVSSLLPRYKFRNRTYWPHPQLLEDAWSQFATLMMPTTLHSAHILPPHGLVLPFPVPKPDLNP